MLFHNLIENIIIKTYLNPNVNPNAAGATPNEI